MSRAVSQKTARIVMGNSYLGIEHAVEHLKVVPSKADLRALKKIPFSRVVLEVCKNTHILVAVFPLSILDIQNRVNRLLFYFKDDPWYCKKSFAKNKGQAHWALVRIVPNSTSKTWQEQQSLLGKDEETPTARVLVYTVILTYLATGIELLPRCIYVRVNDLDSVGLHVDIGFNDCGIVISSWADDSRINRIGVSSVRRPTLTVGRSN